MGHIICTCLPAADRLVTLMAIQGGRLDSLIV